ncbi:hypothetical protein M0812_29184 [Anaeramoeba flamelloides]|uniref:Uncharacterized protein n=1 Tax=Anaeramoeba flamelloides TaxID=1746091 RepID=A0AAV7Y3V2_9EUKA|nr:hypothetical protein M0812_29184 [Anaeramoeba flamelloides]
MKIFLLINKINNNNEYKNKINNFVIGYIQKNTIKNKDLRKLIILYLKLNFNQKQLFLNFTNFLFNNNKNHNNNNNNNINKNNNNNNNTNNNLKFTLKTSVISIFLNCLKIKKFTKEVETLRKIINKLLKVLLNILKLILNSNIKQYSYINNSKLFFFFSSLLTFVDNFKIFKNDQSTNKMLLKISNKLLKLLILTKNGIISQNLIAISDLIINLLSEFNFKNDQFWLKIFELNYPTHLPRLILKKILLINDFKIFNNDHYINLLFNNYNIDNTITNHFNRILLLKNNDKIINLIFNYFFNNFNYFFNYSKTKKIISIYTHLPNNDNKLKLQNKLISKVRYSSLKRILLKDNFKTNDDTGNINDLENKYDNDNANLNNQIGYKTKELNNIENIKLIYKNYFHNYINFNENQLNEQLIKMIIKGINKFIKIFKKIKFNEYQKILLLFNKNFLKNIYSINLLLFKYLNNNFNNSLKIRNFVYSIFLLSSKILKISIVNDNDNNIGIDIGNEKYQLIEQMSDLIERASKLNRNKLSSFEYIFQFLIELSYNDNKLYFNDFKNSENKLLINICKLILKNNFLKTYQNKVFEDIFKNFNKQKRKEKKMKKVPNNDSQNEFNDYYTNENKIQDRKFKEKNIQ